MTDSFDLMKKIEKNANNALWNILCLVLGVILIFATNGFAKAAGWFFAGIGVVGLILKYHVHQELAKEIEKNNRAITMKQCPACAEDIKIEAKKCKHCGEILA